MTVATPEKAQELHTLAFPSDLWVGDEFPEDEHQYWLLHHKTRVVGFCSAVLWPERKAVFLSRAALIRRVQGLGLHKAMVRNRVEWAWNQGVDRVVTYTTLQNYPSLINLLDSGFRFYQPAEPWVGTRVHYLQLVRT